MYFLNCDSVLYFLRFNIIDHLIIVIYIHVTFVFEKEKKVPSSSQLPFYGREMSNRREREREEI